MNQPARSMMHSTQSTNLADLLERILDKGIVIAGDIKVKLVEIELLTIQIRLVICSVDKAREMGMDWWASNPAFGAQPQQAALPEATLGRLEERLGRIEESLARAANLVPVLAAQEVPASQPLHAVPEFLAAQEVPGGLPLQEVPAVLAAQEVPAVPAVPPSPA